MTKEELALVIIDRLKKEYPDAGCTLDYDHAFSSPVYRRQSQYRSGRPV